jgi:nitrous oxide reductase accessory protein NosL
MYYLNERQQLTLDYLQENQTVTIRELQAHFDIPTATLYRDVRVLVDAGLAEKIRGGITLKSPGDSGMSPKICAHCGIHVMARNAFPIQLEDKKQICACCAHCGLVLLDQYPSAKSALAADFLYGNMINVRQATFVLESGVRLCCTPSVLCFGSLEEARKFHKGFGGRVASFEDALAEIRELMSLDGNHAHHQ